MALQTISHRAPSRGEKPRRLREPYPRTDNSIPPFIQKPRSENGFWPESLRGRFMFASRTERSFGLESVFEKDGPIIIYVANELGPKPCKRTPVLA